MWTSRYNVSNLLQQYDNLNAQKLYGKSNSIPHLKNQSIVLPCHLVTRSKNKKLPQRINYQNIEDNLLH